MHEYKLIILGGGILGCSLAYELSQRFGGAQIAVLEKENDVARHMSGRNTGVIHRPFYLDPVKKKKFAKAAQDSYHLWKKYASSRGLSWNECGTIEVALTDDQIEDLHKYQKWALKNGMTEDEMEFLDYASLKKLEPNVEAKAGLYCKTDTSVNFGEFTKSLRKDTEKNGVEFIFDFEFKNFKEDGDGITISGTDGRGFKTQFLINCAGGNSLKIAHKMGVAKNYDAMNFRGEYWKIKPEYWHLTKRNIYSVPRHKNFPFLDPHWVITADGSVIIGPNAVPVAGPYTYKGLARNFAEFWQKFFSRPFWNKFKIFFNPEFLALSWSEWRSSLSNKLMVNRLKKFMPKVNQDFLDGPGRAGIRASLIDKKGKFVPEALELYGQNSLHILNYNSPGATGAPAYARYIVDKLISENKIEDFAK